MSTAALLCFHCGLPVESRGRYRVEVEGSVREMCCAGCAAVAGGIVASGLGAFYRDRVPGRIAGAAEDLRIYDDPRVQASFVIRPDPADPAIREAALLVEGIVCPACVWLNEQSIGRLAGVLEVSLHYASRRARVRWDDSKVKLSAILASIGAIGYAARPYDAAGAEAVRRRERRTLVKRFAIAGLAMMQVMMYAIPAYLAGEGEISADIEALMRLASLAMTVPVVLYSAAPFFAGALADARARRLGMDVPVAAGIAIAFAASVIATLTRSGEVWYDSITMFVFLLLAARLLESTARERAVRTIEALAQTAPATATRLPRFPAQRGEETVPALALAAGEFVLVRAGDVVAADGTIVEGASRFDESPLTGESRPVARAQGEAIIAGAANVASAVVMRVERAGGDTWLSALARSVEQAARAKPSVMQLADRYAAVFVPVIVFAALASGCVWWAIEPARAVAVTIAVLVVTCPCALSLATPIALTAAAGSLARRGVLLTRPGALETLARVTDIAFDKTGTLTGGAMRLVRVVPMRDISEAEALALAARVEGDSPHPIARAIRHAACFDMPDGTSIETPGAGVERTIDGCGYRVGTPRFAGALHGRPLEDDAGVVLADARGWIARFEFDDPLRVEARAAVNALSNYSLAIISGDRTPAVERVGTELGIARRFAECAPHAKQAHVAAMQDAGAVVAMVGDGVNDAPGLARAHVAVALASGTPASRARADVVLLSDRLDGLALALATARRARAVVAQNLAWAFAYNLAAVPAAAAGMMPPWLAGLGMAVSSLAVIANSMRLAR